MATKFEILDLLVKDPRTNLLNETYKFRYGCVENTLESLWKLYSQNLKKPGILSFCNILFCSGHDSQSSQLTPEEIDIVQNFLAMGVEIPFDSGIDDPALSMCLLQHSLKRLKPQKALMTRLSTCLKLFEKGSFHSAKLILEGFTFAQVFSFYRGKKPDLTAEGRRVLYEYRLKQVEKQGLLEWMVVNKRCPSTVGRLIGEFLFKHPC